MTTAGAEKLLWVGVAALACVSASGALLGIDWGHEYAKVAIVERGQPFHVVTNVQSKRKTPMMLSLHEEERTFGADAESLLSKRPWTVIQGAHQLLGANVSHPRVRDFQHRLGPAYELREGSRGEVQFVLPGSRTGEGSAEEAFSAEEVSAQYLKHVKDFTEQYAGGPVRDIVLTVPSFFGQAERMAALQSAELAGFNVLSLTEENIAAAVFSSIDWQPKEDRHILLMLNLGSMNMEATAFAFSTAQTKSRGKKDTVRTIEVLGKAWDETLGGRTFDRVILDRVVQWVDEKHGTQIPGGSVLGHPRAMAKLRKTVQKVKEILSVNEEFPLTVESLLPDLDIRFMITKSQAEEWFQPLCARVADIAIQALQAANLAVEDVHSVEILGGGTRVPSVQRALESRLNGLALGVHLNADEAMALGAAYMAANQSKAFRVRPVWLTDHSPFPVDVRVLEQGEEATQVEEEESQWKSLIAAGGRTGVVRSLKMRRRHDFLAELVYPEGSNNPSSIMNVSVSGVDDLLAKYPPIDPEDDDLSRSVRLRLKLDRSGLMEVVDADATVVEEVPDIPSPTPTLAAASDADKSAAGESTEEDATKEEPTTASDAETDETEGVSAGDESETPSEEAARTLQEEQEEGSGEQDAAATAEESTEKKTKLRKRRVPLTVSEVIWATPVKPMDEEAYKTSDNRLELLDQRDRERKLREKARNQMEEFLFSTQAQPYFYNEDAKQIVSDEHLQELSDALEAADEWLFVEADHAPLESFRSERKKLKELVDPIDFRYKERTNFPAAVREARETLKASRERIAAWATEKPWIESEDIQRAQEAMDELETILDDAESTWNARDPTAPTDVSSKSVKSAHKSAIRTFLSVDKIPEPTPTPEPSPEATEKEEADDNTAGGDEKGDGEEETGEKEAEGEQEEENQGKEEL